MAFECVLDDGQAQTCAAAVAVASVIDTVETFGQARQMFRRDALAVVTHAESSAAIIQMVPAYLDGAVQGRVIYGIGNEIYEHAADFLQAA